MDVEITAEFSPIIGIPTHEPMELIDDNASIKSLMSQKDTLPTAMEVELKDQDTIENGETVKDSSEEVEETEDLESKLNNEIRPDHYYEEGGVPVFKPTYEQFKDFYAFVSNIDSFGMQSGLVKIIPPKEWRNRVFPISTSKLSKVVLPVVIQQEFKGECGIFRQLNVAKKKDLSVSEWKALAECDTFKPPLFDEIGFEKRLSKKHENQENQIQNQQQSEEAESNKTDMKEEQNDNDSTETEKVNEQKTEEEKIYDLPLNTEPMVMEDKYYFPSQNFPKDKSYYQNLERFYWKNLIFNFPYYGADVQGSLFDEKENCWNISKLDSLLTKLAQPLPGVNTPYLYFGMWRSTFSWHLEDMDLYSINYIHYGAPKQWYVVPPEHHERFKRLAVSHFPHDFKACSEFLRHKSYLFSPTFLQSNSIPYHKVVQEEGEIIITFPYGYHSGYNLGYNCAESVNFALKRWIEIGKKSKTCQCTEDAVKIDVEAVFEGKQRFYDTDIPKEICYLCNRCGGQMAQIVAEEVEGNRKVFAHNDCLLYIPETLLEIVPDEEDEYEEENIEVGCGLKMIPKSRFQLKCQYCNVRGACIQCAHPSCKSAFHVTCATQRNLYSKREIVEENGVKICIFKVYCYRHHPEKKQQPAYEPEPVQWLDFL